MRGAAPFSRAVRVHLASRLQLTVAPLSRHEKPERWVGKHNTRVIYMAIFPLETAHSDIFPKSLCAFFFPEHGKSETEHEEVAETDGRERARRMEGRPDRSDCYAPDKILSTVSPLWDTSHLQHPGDVKAPPKKEEMYLTTRQTLPTVCLLLGLAELRLKRPLTDSRSITSSVSQHVRLSSVLSLTRHLFLPHRNR